MTNQLLFRDLGISLKYSSGKFKGRPVRYLSDKGLFQVGREERYFDRWANSVSLTFNLNCPKGRNKLAKWAKE